MKLYYTKLIIICLTFFIPAFSFAQINFQGKAYYESKTTMDMDFGRRDMNEGMKKRISERMKSMFEKTYILTFNKSESTYKEEEKLKASGAQSGDGFRMMANFTGGVQYKNVKDGKLLQEQEFFGKQFLVNDSLPKLEWKMSSDTKQIGNYSCYKATAIKKVDELDFRSMRRRDTEKENKEEKAKDSTAAKSLMDEIEVPNEVTVTAWYTPQIPVSQGPGKYHGLPGLILEVNSDRTTILCSKIILNPDEKEELKVPSKGIQ